MSFDRVTFKEEDEDRSGRVIGPVVAVDTAAMEADPNVTPLGGAVMVPFDYKPDWMREHGWHTRAEARRIAKSYGVALDEG